MFRIFVWRESNFKAIQLLPKLFAGENSVSIQVRIESFWLLKRKLILNQLRNGFELIGHNKVR